MGRAIGKAHADFIGARVTAESTYTPGYVKADGKKVSARISIPICVNSSKGTDQKTGEKGRKDYFTVIAWGKLADICAKALSKGRAIDVFAQPQTYVTKLKDAQGNLRTDATGQAIEITKTAFVMTEAPILGEEADKYVQEEIMTGRRPANWNRTGHPDKEMFRKLMTDWNSVPFNPNSPKYGHAKVSLPRGQGITLDFTVPPTGPVQPVPTVQYANPNMMNFAGAPSVPNGMQNMVMHAANGQPVYYMPAPNPGQNNRF